MAAPEVMAFVMPGANLIQHVVADIKTEMPVTQVCQKKSDGTCPLSDCPCGNNQ
ncbi:hypothetical protein [Psychromonas sp.]|uniref:hypothetical protein n=1 Tax=Psychromonas sp. TaxID=1884585 RepID=UPI003A96ED9D